MLAEEREAAATAGVTPGTRAGFLAALQFRLSPNNVNVARVRMLSAKMGHVVPAEMRPKVWAHLLLGSDLWEDKAFHAWDESEKKTEYPVYQQLLADSKRISSKDVETEEMSALLAFFCYRRDASEYAQALLSCSYPLVKLKLESRAITSSCFYSFTSSLTPGLMLPKKTRFDLIQEYHHAFKLLLSYHDPLLAQHLDRRVVDWHLPPNTPNTDHVLQMTAQEDDTSTNPSTKKSDLLGDGQVPSAALTALFSELLPLSHLYPLWDHLLGCSLGIQSTDKNKDGISSGEGRLLQPFLLLSLLLREHASLVTFDGDVLIQSLKKCLSLVNFSAQGNDSNSGSGVSSFMIDDDVNNDKEEDKEEDVKKKAIEDAKADVSRLEEKLETASQALAIAVEKKNEMEAKELKSKEDGEKDNTEKDGEKEKEEDEDEKSLTKQLEELEENKKQAASEKNFKLAGSIAKEIKALKEKIASSDSGVTLKERKENVDAAISAVGIAKTLLEDATSKLNALTQSEDGTPPLPSSNTSSSASPFAACHIDRLKQCVGAQEWLVYAGLGCYLTGFAAKEINLLDDILDPELCSDEDLTSPPIFMSNKDMKYFRKLVNACSTNQDGEEGGETQKKQSNHRDIEFSLHYQAQGPTTQEYSEIDISVMQWCLESYELFRRTPTSFIIHALKDAESRHLTKTLEDDDMMNGINNDDDDGSKPSQKEADEEDGGGGGSCLGRFCIEVSVGELVPQLCKAAAHGNDVRGRSASVTAAGQQAQQLKIDKLNPASKSLLERAIDMATLGVMTKGSCSTLQYLGRENAQFQKPRFLCLDCRPGAHITRWGKFATTFSLDTPLDSISQDPEAMERLFSMFSSMSGRAHIVLMGVGPDTSESSLSIMSQSSSQSSRVNNIETCGLKSIEDIHAERSQLAGLVLLFHKHNFPLVSVLEGGFAAAHLFLSQMSQLRMIPGSNSLPECGLHDLIDVGQPVKKSFFSTISAPSVKLPSYSMSTSSSTFSLSTSSLLSSSSTAPSGGSTSRYAFSSLRPKSSVNEGSESDTQRNSLTPTNDDGGGGDVNDKKLDKEEETSQDTESPSRPSEGASESEIGSEAKALAAEALEMMANANMAHNDSEPEPARESVSSMRTAFNFSSMADRLMSSSKQPSATTKATQSDESPQCEEGSSASLPVDDVKKLADTPNKTPDTTPPAPSSTPSSSTTSTTSAAAAAAASSMYSSMSNMRFSFASKTQTQPATPAPAPKVAPPAAPSSEELEALQNKALTHGHRLDCGGLEKGEVSIAHMKVAGLLKGSEVIINGETFPNAALFRCQKLKMKSEEFGSVKLSEVPRVDRAIVITKDRVLVLNYAVKDDNVTPSAVVTDDVVGDDQKKTEERVSIGNESNIDKNDNKSSNENNVGNDNNIEDKTKETQNQEPSNKEAEDKKMTIQSDQGVETASQLTSLGAIVKSNHHLTEIVKMTMLKKEPDILTLHFRAGASYDTSTLEGVRRRAYKMHGGKDEFIECLQVAMERFI